MKYLISQNEFDFQLNSIKQLYNEFSSLTQTQSMHFILNKNDVFFNLPYSIKHVLTKKINRKLSVVKRYEELKKMNRVRQVIHARHKLYLKSLSLKGVENNRDGHAKHDDISNSMEKSINRSYENLKQVFTAEYKNIINMKK
tara:strand:+ start:2320 stop:2745 length:426 start_codon:yes stop_codon:yes gene_type:complete